MEAGPTGPIVILRYSEGSPAGYERSFGVPQDDSLRATPEFIVLSDVTESSTAPRLRERLPQHLKRLGNSRPWVFLAFKLQRNIPAIPGRFEDLGDSRVVQVERVPQPAAE